MVSRPAMMRLRTASLEGSVLAPGSPRSNLNLPESSATQGLSVLVAKRHVEREEIETGDLILLVLLDASLAFRRTLVDDFEGEVVEHFRSFCHRFAATAETLGNLPEGAAEEECQ